MKLVKTILNDMENISKAQKDFFALLMQMIVSIYGKINFRNLARHSNKSEKTFRRNFKKDFDFLDFNSKAIGKIITNTEKTICAFDPSFIKKAGKKTYGLSKFWNSCISKSVKGLELSLFALVNVDVNEAYSLISNQTPSNDEIKKTFKSENLDSETTRIDYYLSIVTSISSTILKFTKFFVVDGYLCKKKFVDGVTNLGFTFVSKLRVDANLRFLYNGEKKQVEVDQKSLEKNVT